MTDLVERVARALWDASGDPAQPFENLHIADQAELMKDARAALAVVRVAMHDIPPEAIRAMAIAVSEGARPMPDAARALADVMFKEEGNG